MTDYLIEPLASHHDRKSFCSGIKELDHYFQHQAGQDARKNITASFVLMDVEKNCCAGFYTLSSTVIDAGALPESFLKKMPKYPLLPATLLGRLAVGKNFQRKRLGELLLIDALKRSLNASEQVASLAMVVDAKNEDAENFYKHYGFIVFPKQEKKLFLPMLSIKKLILS